MAKRIVMTGATGFIGQRVAAALLARGDAIVLLSRHPEQAKARFPTAERCLLWAPGLEGAWRTAIDGVDAVIHLAGESIAGKRWNAAFKQRLRDSRVRGTRDIVAAIAQAQRKPELLISASGIGYYGDSGDAFDSETAPPGRDFLAELCSAWEAEAMEARQSGVRVTVFRTGLVLARDGGALPRLALPFSLLAGGPIGSGRQWFPWIHAEDMVSALLSCVDTPALAGPVNAVAPQQCRNDEFCAALGKALHRPSWLRVPAFALRLAAGEFADSLLGGQRATPDALLANGFRFRYPRLDEALASLYNPT